MNRNINAYMINQINTTSAENLVIMLYDGARKFLNRAIKALQDGDIQEANHNFLRTQSIVAELMAGVNFEAGVIANKLFSLYEYMHYRLVQANIKKEIEPAQEILMMINELRETWAQMLKETNTSKAPMSQQKVAGIGK